MRVTPGATGDQDVIQAKKLPPKLKTNDAPTAAASAFVQHLMHHELRLTPLPIVVYTYSMIKGSRPMPLRMATSRASARPLYPDGIDRRV
jgi:hypothetical protein